MRHKMNAIDTRSKAPRAQGGKGLLSHKISVQESQKSMAKTSIPREEKGGGRKRGREAHRKEEGSTWTPAKKREREEKGYLWCPRRGPKYP